MACPTPTHMASYPQYRHIPCSIAGGKNSMHIACLQPTNHPAKEPGQDCFVLVQVQCSQPTDHIWIGYICIYVYIYIYYIDMYIYICTYASPFGFYVLSFPTGCSGYMLVQQLVQAVADGATPSSATCTIAPHANGASHPGACMG